MSAALTLVVLIASHDATDPTADAFRNAARSALGTDVQVVVRSVPQLPSDEAALEAGRAESAYAVAEVTWVDPEHRHAALHVHTQSAGRWIDRDIGFDAADADVERARTLGFAVAAMMPDRARTTEPPAPLVDVTATEALSREAGGAAPPIPLGAVDVMALGAAGGDATGAGGGLAIRAFVGSHLALVASGGARAGQDSGAQATVVLFYGAVGLGWRAFRPDAPFRFGGRIDALAMHESLSRSGTPADSQARWVPAADLLAEGSWRLTRGAAVVLGLGGETAFGTTDVFVRGQKVSTIPSLRLIATLGVEASF